MRCDQIFVVDIFDQYKCGVAVDPIEGREQITTCSHFRWEFL